MSLVARMYVYLIITWNLLLIVANIISFYVYDFTGMNMALGLHSLTCIFSCIWHILAGLENIKMSLSSYFTKNITNSAELEELPIKHGL